MAREQKREYMQAASAEQAHAASRRAAADRMGKGRSVEDTRLTYRALGLLKQPGIYAGRHKAVPAW